jgi:hypothetical protein
MSMRRSSSSSARLACVIAISVPRRPDRAITMAMISSNTSASAPKAISAAPVRTGTSPTMKRIWFIRPLYLDSRPDANEERTL